ncbi:hypothetical protein BJP40_28810 [Streptomyces sp. CC53]|uniref:hypothetical protein n=1 Tax=unclassified Streptomyces TaxID=2593676 RepID=UPI0008DD5BBA|nr:MULTISPECIES: hypothetical protein [unclassified Streptomyces]OII59723.1 hypothetical protein BJP39_11630 [Streptomyces sp. CC77]OII62373.1 hypothetical protein BJP40_28810 [Streptomyces sp. CC53]
MRIGRVALVAGAAALAAALTGGSAHADESNTHSHNGPRVALVNAGQIDDPMEDVLEHVAVLGRNLIID